MLSSGAQDAAKRSNHAQMMHHGPCAERALAKSSLRLIQVHYIRLCRLRYGPYTLRCSSREALACNAPSLFIIPFLKHPPSWQTARKRCSASESHLCLPVLIPRWRRSLVIWRCHAHPVQ